MSAGRKYHVSGKICGGPVYDDVHIDIQFADPDYYLMRQLRIETDKPEPELSEESQKIKAAAEEAAYRYQHEPVYNLPSLGKYKDGDLNFGAPHVDELYSKREPDDDEEPTLRVTRNHLGCFITISNEVVIL